MGAVQHVVVPGLQRRVGEDVLGREVVVDLPGGGIDHLPGVLGAERIRIGAGDIEKTVVAGGGPALEVVDTE